MRVIEIGDIVIENIFKRNSHTNKRKLCGKWFCGIVKGIVCDLLFPFLFISIAFASGIIAGWISKGCL